jgi:MFS transporter, FHS family, L-fucose permease
MPLSVFSRVEARFEGAVTRFDDAIMTSRAISGAYIEVTKLEDSIWPRSNLEGIIEFLITFGFSSPGSFKDSGVRSMVEEQQRSNSFAMVATLFFAMGFITSLIDPLIPSVKAIFQLSYAQSMLTQFTFFLAYGIVSLPGGWVVSRFGYSRSVVAALAITTAGCLVIPLSTRLEAYWLVLLSLFIIASGLTILQVAANPLAASLGPRERSHFRLTLSQAFNSLGTVIGPFFGAMIMLRGGVFAGAGTTGAMAADRRETLQGIDVTFLVIAALVVGLIALTLRARRNLDAVATHSPTAGGEMLLGAVSSPWALFGALAIFLYVGAEVSIGSLMINFLHDESVLGVSIETAGKLLTLYWLGAMVGRFAGSLLLARFPASRILGCAAIGAAILCFCVTQVDGPVAAIAALMVGLHNSIMFPTIFTLTLERSKASTAQTSALLCVAIIGGALFPLIVGYLGDKVGLRAAFFVPMLSYVLIAGFAAAPGTGRIHAARGVVEAE